MPPWLGARLALAASTNTLTDDVRDLSPCSALGVPNNKLINRYFHASSAPMPSAEDA
jgi:hypothetical protein